MFLSIDYLLQFLSSQLFFCFLFSLIKEKYLLGFYVPQDRFQQMNNHIMYISFVEK